MSCLFVMRGWRRALLASSASFFILAACGLDDSVIEALSVDSPDGSSDATVDAPGDANSADSSFDGSFADADSSAPDTGILSDAEADAADTGVDAEVDAGSDAAGEDAGDASVDAGPCPTLTLCDSNASVCGGGQVCVPQVPAGWALVGFDPSSGSVGSSCGASYTAHSAIDLTDGGTTKCDCACNAGAAPSCSNDQVVLTTGTGCTAASTTESVTSSCTDLGASYTVSGSLLQAHVQADPTTCAAALDASIPSWDGGTARECDFTGGSSAFCANHATCVAASSASHQVCIKQAYSGALPAACNTRCPTGFQSSCFATASSLSDSRACTSCTCAWSDPGCGSPTITGSDMSGCAGDSTHNIPIAADTCAAFPLATVTALALIGDAGAPSCDMTAPASASGSVTPGGESIVCCAN